MTGTEANQDGLARPPAAWRVGRPRVGVPAAGATGAATLAAGGPTASLAPAGTVPRRRLTLAEAFRSERPTSSSNRNEIKRRAPTSCG